MIAIAGHALIKSLVGERRRADDALRGSWSQRVS